MVDLRTLIRDVPGFPKPGIVFKDIMPLVADPVAFRQAVGELAEFARPLEPDVILGAEARGFIFGAALAYELGIGFAAARKPGKLPYETIRATYASVRHRCARAAARRDRAGTRVLIHDDLLATGGTAKAKVDLVEQLGGIPVGAAFVIELSFLSGREALAPLPVHSLMAFDSE